MVKATEFIGQSSGKTSKGQNQKVQQAVLQKFRDGEYNVIVATSIGEEGLDIMEVDLVICFDANISSLRMTQRMGRTARKNAGRVVVLACDGQELKGYLKKQANNKAIKKHMYKGGSRSFSFHPSPRMVPHSCKPVVQFVEVSIDRSASQGRLKKSHTSSHLEEISKEESELIAKYFHHFQGDARVLSLIAFPRFQAFPSRVHKLQHSFRNSLFIRTVQCLHGISHKECELSSKNPVELLALHAEENDLGDSDGAPHGVTCSLGETGGPSIAVSPSTSHKPIFNTSLVSVDSLGNVIVASVCHPSLVKESLHSKFHNMNFEACRFGITAKVQNLPSESVSFLNIAALVETEIGCADKQRFLSCKVVSPEKNCQQFSPEPEIVPQTPHEQLILSQEDAAADMLETKVASVPMKMVLLQGAVNNMYNGFENKGLKPSINHFIERGIVPESPVASHIFSGSEDPGSSVDRPRGGGILAKCLTGKSQEINVADAVVDLLITPDATKETSSLVLASNQPIKASVYHSPASEVPIPEMKERCNFSISPHNAFCTPNIKQAAISSSGEWQPHSEEVCASVKYAPKYKRLRRYTDTIKIPMSTEFKNEVKTTSLLNSSSPMKEKTSPATRVKGRNKTKVHGMTFIEEEAEVSDDADVSQDEGEDDEDKYDDSFIDDRAEPTISSTQARNSGDMMAFYRRSLLSQSPGYTPLHSCSIPDSSGIMEGESCSPECTSISLSTPQVSTSLLRKVSTEDATGNEAPSNIVDISSPTSKNGTCLLEKFTAAGHQAVSMRKAQQKTTGESSVHLNNHRTTESRKRKLSFQDLETRSSLQMLSGGYLQSGDANESTCDVEHKQTNQSKDAILDDDFYMGLDFDVLEAQATEILKAKSTKPSASGPLKLATDDGSKTRDNASMMSIPSFDLGI